MPITLMDVLTNTRPVQVPWMGEVLTVQYRPGEYSFDLMEALDGEAKEGKNRLVRLLVRMIASWDLLGDDGTPTTAEERLLMRLPIQLLNKIGEAILEDYSSGNLSAAVSPSG